MQQDLFKRYVWLIDTIKRHGHISRGELDRLWQRSPEGDGKPLPKRTFFHHRRAIESIFGIDIECNPRGEYYISQVGENHNNAAYRNWLLDSYAMRSVLEASADISERIIVEAVPSAREHLSTVVEAMRTGHKIRFTYKGYSRSQGEEGILLHPYLVRLYRQRWYVIGYKEGDGSVKTYALDRTEMLTMEAGHFDIPEGSDPAGMFEDCFGITYSRGEVKRISLQVTPAQAKYFRTLPLHHSQQEELHDGYSIFRYKVKITYDLIREILSYGSAVRVIAPRELELMVQEQLRLALKQYGGGGQD